MSTADLAVLGLTAESLTATVGCLRLALQIARGTAQQQERGAAVPESPRTVTAQTPALTGRQAKFNALIAEGKSLAEAGAALGMALRTAQTYEKQRKSAQNGAGS